MQGCSDPVSNPAYILPGRSTNTVISIFLGIPIFFLMFFPAELNAQQKKEVKYRLGPQLLPIEAQLPDHNPSIGNLITTCTNSDFSLGTFADWIGCYGIFNTSQFLPCQTPGFAITQRRHVIEKTPSYRDPYSCDSIQSVFPGEEYSARLGDTSGGGHAEQLKYNVPISSNNYLFIYRYAVVLESPNHTVNQQGIYHPGAGYTWKFN